MNIHFPIELIPIKEVSLLKLKWWEKDEQWIKDHAHLFSDVNQLLDSLR
jgi:hypothetical protein